MFQCVFHCCKLLNKSIELVYFKIHLLHFKVLLIVMTFFLKNKRYMPSIPIEFLFQYKLKCFLLVFRIFIRLHTDYVTNQQIDEFPLTIRAT